MRDSRFEYIDAAQILLGGFNSLADRRRHFLGLADAKAHYLGGGIADHHQRREAEILAALHDFGDAIDRHHLLFEVQGRRIDTFY